LNLKINNYIFELRSNLTTVNMDQNNSVSSQSLNYNANKVRWLTDTQLTPSDMFVLGSSENVVSIFKIFI